MNKRPELVFIKPEQFANRFAEFVQKQAMVGTTGLAGCRYHFARYRFLNLDRLGFLLHTVSCNSTSVTTEAGKARHSRVTMFRTFQLIISGRENRHFHPER